VASERSVTVGGVQIGGGAPPVVQSMTLTKTHDVEATTAQIAALASAGCEIVRVAVPKSEDADALPRIVRFSPIPVIADIHFNASLALRAIEAGVAAVRINPGNIGGADKVEQVVRAAKAKGTPMRIGANSGSLPKHLADLAQEDLAIGEEFAVLLPATSSAVAAHVAERLRAAIAHASDPTSVTASAGVATMPANAVDGSTLVAAADEALYVAKRGGRDRSCQSSRRGGVRLSA